ncbi:MAG TPA: tetratricopeptide repeat protein [Micromonosporaceae bacterium]|jgi:putative thioredoxin
MTDPRTAPSILTRGAVDLGALRSSPPPGGTPPSGAAPPSGGASGTIFDVTVQTFQQDVMERSLTTPVIVEFGQTGAFQPALESLARESGGAWVLGRVDVGLEANRQLVQMFRLQAVPTVYAVVGGQPVDAFNGVLPEAQLRQWIAAVCQAGGVEVEVPEDPRFAGADEAMVNGDLDEAERAYRQILADAPADADAEAGLAQVELLRRAQGVDPQAVLAAADAAPDDIEAQTLAADVEVLGGTADRAYARLVDLVRRTSGAERDTVRAHLISLFLVAGSDDPAVAVARRALASALF